MTILLDPRRNVDAIEAEPTADDRAYAAETCPHAGEHHAPEPTPVEALVEPAPAAREECRCEEPGGRYVLRRERRGGFAVLDREARAVVGWYGTFREAADRCTDLVAEDHEPLVIGGRPWYEAPYPVALWDGPRVTPTSL